ncbi:EamA family transporter RarD [Marinomonas posidonica]|uniref:RarD protein, DMT superfamily transporter n=1 Tax=Marinomonas posidonica (strain CECT 7376 / NCIMB 14433 / IVIA-Po-181) TaxID=491952 RepID=F6CWE2_MARPP|nr:EamA family transporter RarD [Marinomonas posidonica]AEF53197.1 RarD protein, DMT superfamily transporter [Marinomonas posidonica IVIA-Po-181]
MPASSKSGLMLAFTAFFLWAIAPIYFKEMSFVPAQEILAHRIIWSCILVFVLIFLLRYSKALITALTSKKVLMSMLASTLLIGFNWGTFIWAVQNNQMLSASLGYYINPLISILLGVVFFKEKLDPIRQLAVALCFCAVVFEVFQFGSLPWVALVLAVTFGVYGLIRKKAAVDSFTGMAIETSFMLPIAIIYLLLSPSPTANLLDNNATINWLLFASGPVTMVPLMCFAAAANRVNMSTLGFMQYIGPTGMFILAVFVYDEPLSSDKLITFVLIWSALAMLIFDSIRRLRNARRKPIQPVEPI